MNRHFKYYALSEIISKLFLFLLIPLLTEKLTSHQYGIITNFLTISVLITNLSNFGGDSFIAINYHKNKNIIDQFYSNQIIITIILNILILPALCLLNFLSIINLQISYIIILSASSIFTNIILNTQTLHQFSEKSHVFAIFQISISIVDTVLAIVFLYYLNLNEDSRIYAYAISKLTAGVIIFIIYKKSISVFKLTNTRLYELKQSINFGAKLVPHLFGSWLMNGFDRYMLIVFVNLSEAGIYSIAMQLSLIVTMITLIFDKISSPRLYKILYDNNKKQKLRFVKLTYLFILSLIFISFIYIEFLFIMKSFILGKQFYGALNIIPIIIVGLIFSSAKILLDKYLYYSKSTFLISKISLNISILSIPIYYVLIKYFSNVGAALAFMLTNITYCVVIFLNVNKLKLMPWRLLRT